MRNILTFFLGKKYLIKNQIATPNETNHRYKAYEEVFYKYKLKINKKTTENISKNKLYNFRKCIIFNNYFYLRFFLEIALQILKLIFSKIYK